MESVERYKKKAYDVHNLRVRKDGKSGITLEDIRAHAESRSESINGFIIRAILEQMQRDKQQPPQ